MANKNYYRWGDQELIKVPVDDTTVVEIGDFICLVVAADSSGDATLTDDYGCPPSYLVGSVTEGTAQAAAEAQFLGIAMSASLDGDTDDLLVATRGVFELVQATAAAISIGDQLEIAWSTPNCLDQQVNTGAEAIAICIEHKTSTTLTGVMCKLIPSVLLDDAAHS